MKTRTLLFVFAWLAIAWFPKPACAIQTQEVDIGRDGVYDGVVKIVRDEHGRMMLSDAQTSPVTLNDLRYNGVAHWLLLGLEGDDHPQYLNAVRALAWLAARSTSDLPEGTRLYYTDARARGAVSADSPLNYNSSTGVFGVDPLASPVFEGLTLSGLPSGAVPYTASGGALAANASVLSNVNGNIGIGTASPAYQFVVNNSSNKSLYACVDASNFATFGSDTSHMLLKTAGSLQQQIFGTGDTWTVRQGTTNYLLCAKGNGAIGVGTPTPSSRLTVSGNASVGSGYASIAAPADGLIVQGRVGIGTSSPAAPLDVNGSGRIRGALNIDGETTSAALNIAGPPRLVNSAAQIVTTDTQSLSPGRGFVILDPTENRNLGSCPTIAAGAEGQLLVITNQDPDYYVRLSNDNLLAGSKLALGSGTRTLYRRDVLTLIWTGGYWCELSFSANH